MSASAPTTPASSATRDLRLAFRQVYYEQISFWRNPVGAVFTVGFSVIFLLLLAGNGAAKTQVYGGISQIQYYVPGFVAYGVMSACFNNLAIATVIRREMGLLKRLRLAPIPNWVMFAGVLLNAVLVAALQVFVLLMVGRFGYHVHLPGNYLAFFVALLVGIFCFTALGFGISSIMPNQESAAPLVSIVFFVLLFLSGLWFPLKSGSGLAKISAYFPVRHMILATFAPFDLQRGASPWAPHDLEVMLIWGVIGVFLAVRYFRWEPRKR